jgi:hypothetical protein
VSSYDRHPSCSPFACWGSPTNSADAKGKVKLPVRPSGKAKRRLTERGRAKVEAEVTYTPTGGDPNVVANTDTKALKLIKRR